MKNVVNIVIGLALLLIACEVKEDQPPKKTTAKDSAQHSEIDTAKLFDSAKSTIIKEAGAKEPVIHQSDTTKRMHREKPGIHSITELWNRYKTAKATVDEALEKGDVETAITNLKIAGNAALELGRPGIAAWQFNNISHYLIEEFKKKTDYEIRMRTLAKGGYDEKRTAYIAETKMIFKKHIALLERAQKQLTRAQIIDDELIESRRTEVIKSNVEFVEWMFEYIE